eukprot:3568668-Pleurochrysis_carterae.AAC.1
MSGARAAQRLKVGKLGSDARRDHERGELLSVGAERTHGEGDARCVVPAAQVFDVGRQHPDRCVRGVQEERRFRLPAIRGVFEDVFGAGIACGAEQGGCAAHDLVGFR